MQIKVIGSNVKVVEELDYISGCGDDNCLSISSEALSEVKFYDNTGKLTYGMHVLADGTIHLTTYRGSLQTYVERTLRLEQADGRVRFED